MSAGTVRGTDARAFVKAFNGICNWNGFWERWNDMVKQLLDGTHECYQMEEQ